MDLRVVLSLTFSWKEESKGGRGRLCFLHPIEEGGGALDEYSQLVRRKRGGGELFSPIRGAAKLDQSLS